MDNLTHSLLGLAAAKAGLEKLSPGATTLCVLAANAPDADIVVRLFTDRWGVLQHHRGITHAVIGTLALGLLQPIFFYLGDYLLSKFRKRPPTVKFVGLLVASIVVSATHPLLDWTNNYGVRFFLPWDARWFYGDFVFIVDPFIWLTLGGACFLLTSRTKLQRVFWIVLGAIPTALILLSPRGANLPNPWLIRGIWLAALVCLIVLSGKKIGERVGARVALVSLIIIVVYWCGLGFIHSRAVARAEVEAAALTGSNETVSRLAAMPTLANPFGWDCVFETDKATYRFTLHLIGEKSVTKTVRYEKPSGKLGEAVKKVSQDRPAQIFFGFARFPVARLSNQGCTSQTLVQLADLRYTEPGTSRGAFSLNLPVECPTEK
jgi:inner membrane protein